MQNISLTKLLNYGIYYVHVCINMCVHVCMFACRYSNFCGICQNISCKRFCFLSLK